ncbi:glycerophosphodiester phosphodiesterase [Halosimplex pelagicum]|uniref:Glycerophosphodiester phosphodiesterase n=1 Tax=Halosimplex pelagicum TaxID=869886 RepID=A0A7D5TW85_9EURY|nr:glycerophosphodiester phosphodiesterase [Halosimplex pelagicum]QLH84592.1 glycerophosphodiester phosphodiesterase [Halosimplex pelagicum]
MELVAHRGCPDHGPENTARAVAAAAARLPAVEVDLRRCGSGELVAAHDERVDGFTDGTGRVADLDLAAVRDLRVDGSDEPVATFAEILDAVPAGVTLQVELKEPGLWRDVRAALAADDRSNVRLSSFSAPALAEIARSEWEPETGLLFGDHPVANLDLAAALDCANVHPHARLCLDPGGRALVERAHDAGFGVYAWGLDAAAGDRADPAADDPENRAATVRALADRGVDGVTTDTWDLPQP